MVLRIDENTSIIQAETFAEREDIEEIMLPASVTEIGGAAFAGCVNLKRVSFSGEKNLRQICDGAFAVCNNLQSFDFNDGLEEIGEMAFWETGLEKVNLPESLLSVGDSAFWACEHLEEFNVLNDKCVLGDSVIGECPVLFEGFVAPGFPRAKDFNHADELIYTLLWLSCPQKHSEATSDRAMRFLDSQEELVMAKILESNNTAAMTGMVNIGHPRKNILKYIEEANLKKSVEITNILMEKLHKDQKSETVDSFEI